jgi:hypothetical protein
MSLAKTPPLMLSTSRPVAPPLVANQRRLFVVEREALLLASEQTNVENFDETVALAQLRDESPDDFADRVVRRIGAAAHSAPFSEAMLCASDTCEPAALSARRLIAIAIAAHAETTSSPPELVVVASASISRGARERLLGLTDDLVLGMAGRSLPVRLRFVATAAPAAVLDVSERDAHAHERFEPSVRRCVAPDVPQRERHRLG